MWRSALHSNGQSTTLLNTHTHLQVHFNKDKSLKRELHLVGNADFMLSIVEPLTDAQEESLPINLSVRAVFSKYAVTPGCGINFGPTTYKTTSKPKTFEIANLGEFAFDYALFNYGAGATPPVFEEEKGKGKVSAP